MEGSHSFQLPKVLIPRRCSPKSLSTFEIDEHLQAGAINLKERGVDPEAEGGAVEKVLSAYKDCVRALGHG